MPDEINVCSPENPMPKERVNEQWMHRGASEYDSCSEGCCAYMKCKDCGHTWTQEMPS